MINWKMKPMPASNQYEQRISNFMNIEVKENSQAWSGNSRRTTSRFSSCEPTSLSNLCDHLWEGFFGDADYDAEADTDADA